jgi:hypothetical protein
MGKPLQQDESGKIVNDTETQKTQKGYANYEADNAKKQKEMETKDAKFKETIKSGVEKIRGVMGMKKGGTASSRADGCAIRGKTRA